MRAAATQSLERWPSDSARSEQNPAYRPAHSPSDGSGVASMLSMSGSGEKDGLPGYLPEPPGPEYTIPLPPPAPPSGRFSGLLESWPVGIMPLAFGIIGALVFNLFGVVAIF